MSSNAPYPTPADLMDMQLADLYIRMMELHVNRLDPEGFAYWRKQYEDLRARHQPKERANVG